MLGIDVSKNTLHASLVDPATQSQVWHKRVPNTAAGVETLLHDTPAQTPWALEPTGRYSTLAATLGLQAGRSVRLAQPKAAQLFLASLCPRAKTDTLDAFGLALFALSRPLPSYPVKSEMHEELDQYLSARKGLSAALAALTQQKATLPKAADALEEAIQALKQQIKVLDAQIKACSSAPELNAVQALLKVPGMGPVVASSLVSRLTARSFEHSDQFVAYCGLDVRVRQSGQKHGQLGLSRHGDAELRRLLYLAAQASIRAKNSPFKAQYEREKAKGLASTQALCAIARKMARLAWSLVHNGTQYDPERIYKQPDRKAP